MQQRLMQQRRSGEPKLVKAFSCFVSFSFPGHFFIFPIQNSDNLIVLVRKVVSVQEREIEDEIALVQSIFSSEISRERVRALRRMVSQSYRNLYRHRRIFLRPRSYISHTSKQGF